MPASSTSEAHRAAAVVAPPAEARAGGDGRRLRIAIVYDCLYPHTIGGAERWYRSLASRLASRHDVTYLTRVQWRAGTSPDAPAGVKLIGLGADAPLYTRSGRRRIGPPLHFGIGVFLHLLRNRRAYDVVHTCGFPYFPMMLAAVVARLGGPPVVTDWIEVWPPEYWNNYLGRYGGWVGTLVQRLCIRLTDQAFTFAASTAVMLRRYGYRKEPVILRGMFAGDEPPPDLATVRAPLVVYVGRHIREKHVTAIPAAIARARETIPDLRAIIFGDGPERPRLLEEVARWRLEGCVECPGFADWSLIDEALRRALCLLLPSEREGYGLVILEAAARGTPAIVVQGPHNAAVEFIEDGENGYVAADAGPAALAQAIIQVNQNGASMRRRTAARFKQLEPTFTITSSLARIEQAYRAAAGASALNRT